jgi:hypothetical protein
LWNTPIAIEQVSDVQEVHRQLNLVAVGFGKFDILQNAKIKSVYPWSQRTISFGNLSSDTAQVIVLINVSIQV